MTTTLLAEEIRRTATANPDAAIWLATGHTPPPGARVDMSDHNYDRILGEARDLLAMRESLFTPGEAAVGNRRRRVHLFVDDAASIRGAAREVITELERRGRNQDIVVTCS